MLVDVEEFSTVRCDNKLGNAVVQLCLYSFMLELTYNVPVDTCVAVFSSKKRVHSHVFDFGEDQRGHMHWLAAACHAIDPGRANQVTGTHE